MNNTECLSTEEVVKAADSTTSLSSGNNYAKTSDEILLAEDIDDAEELETTEDESDEDEMAKFFMLMNKAERKNMKRISTKQNQFGSKTSDWRSVNLEDPDEETTDTEDEDDNHETQKFLSLMEKAKKKNTKVAIKWINGQVKLERVQDGIEGEIARREKEKRELELRRLQAKTMKKHETRDTQSRGKRKFEDRMTLNEAKLEDFDDAKDYVNFLQTKLKGVRIKITK